MNKKNEIINIKDFKAAIGAKKAVLGFDYGSKRLGVSVSDIGLMIATAQKIIQRTTFEKDLAEIKKIIAEKEVGGIVYGLPKQMNGEEGEIALEVRKFAEKLSEFIDLPYFFWDERLSSSAVESFLIQGVDMNRKRRKEVLDAAAAAYILQGFLDRLAR